MIIIRQIFSSHHVFIRFPAIALCVAALVAFAGVGDAVAQGSAAALVARPMSLPDMALGTAKAPVTITEYASMTCPHCASFEQNVFPMLKLKYIDTGRVRFVFREYPLDIKAAAASMVTRCAAGDNAEKFFGIIDLMFKQQDQLVAQTSQTLNRIGEQAGMSEQAIGDCEKNQVLLDNLSADQKFAFEVVKVEATPTFVINGEKLKGDMAFEVLDQKIKALLKK